MPVICSRCGQEWPRDPALEVACPVCHAPVGAECRRPSGHRVWAGDIHPERDRLALQVVPGYGRCPAAAQNVHEQLQPGLFSSAG